MLRASARSTGAVPPAARTQPLSRTMSRPKCASPTRSRLHPRVSRWRIASSTEWTLGALTLMEQLTLPRSAPCLRSRSPYLAAWRIRTCSSGARRNSELSWRRPATRGSGSSVMALDRTCWRGCSTTKTRRRCSPGAALQSGSSTARRTSAKSSSCRFPATVPSARASWPTRRGSSWNAGTRRSRPGMGAVRRWSNPAGWCRTRPRGMSTSRRYSARARSTTSSWSLCSSLSRRRRATWPGC
mmetsp:Transcript_17833/g.51865  ORF Transcript_17833/g.51865 Transcript_17833/m.51865 type:complete len:242 (-) Transcript_17833:3341-4066(-)